MIGVLQLIDENPGAVNRDLMDLGYRLRDLEDDNSGLRVTDVLDMVEHAHPDSAIYRVTVGEDWEWGLQEQLLAMLVDTANFRLFQAGGGKGKKPKQLPRPGVTSDETKVYKSETTTTMAEMSAWLEGRVAKE